MNHSQNTPEGLSRGADPSVSTGKEGVPIPPVCPHCGAPMTPGGYAILCLGGGQAGRLALPAHCPSRQCRKARDEEAIERAIADGVIDR